MSHQSISLSLLYQILPMVECCSACKGKQSQFTLAFKNQGDLQRLHGYHHIFIVGFANANQTRLYVCHIRKNGNHPHLGLCPIPRHYGRVFSRNQGRLLGRS